MISAAEVATDTVQYVSDRVTMKAFLARPSHAEAAPGLIILHEWWGLNDQIRALAQRFAREGYAALAPDLYSRLPGPPGTSAGAGGYKVTTDPAEAGKLMESLSSQHALRDINAGVIWLRQQPFVDPFKVGAVGFSMGGTFALIAAGCNSDLKASVCFYGKVPPVETVDYFICPVLFFHAGKDGWVTRQEADRLKDGLAKYGKPGEVRIYPEADHAFFNETRPAVYREADANDAWQRTLAFLAHHLRNQP